MFKIALDLDDVLLSSNDIIIETFKEYGHDKKTALNYMKNWGLPGAPNDVVFSIRNKFISSSHSCDPKRIYNNSREWVKKHKDYFDIIVVTARPEAISEETKQFVNEHFGIDQSRIFVEPHSKTKTLLEQGVEFLIDDGPHNLTPFLTRDSKVIPILISNKLTVYNHKLAKDMAKQGLVVRELSDVTVDYLSSLKNRTFF